MFKKMPFDNGYFDRINAIYILEHLNNLPSRIDEVYGHLNINGIFQVVIPCDPGFVYKICRNISAKRIFEKNIKKIMIHLLNENILIHLLRLLVLLKKNLKT